MSNKRILWLALLVLCLLPLCLVSCSEKATDGLEYQLQEDGTYYVGAGDAREEERIVIPKRHEGKKVTGIFEGGFAKCTNLTEIVIPNSVTVIGDNAFYNCRVLPSIELPKSVRKVDRMAFRLCRAIETVVFKGDDVELGPACFISCSSLTEITLPKNMKVLPYWTFDGCSALQEIKLPAKLLEIGNEAFRSCTALTSISVPKEVKWIATNAFDDCIALTDAHFDGPERIPEKFMQNTASLTTLSFGKGVKVIGSGAFENCEKLTRVTLPDGIERIEGSAFRSCQSLRANIYKNGYYLGSKHNPYLFLITPIQLVTDDYEIHKRAKIIGDFAFRKCTGFTSLTLPDGIRTVEGHLLAEEAPFLLNEYNGGLYLGTEDNPYHYFYMVKDKNATSISLHPDTVIIGPRALYMCKHITEVNISAGVTSIKSGAFLNTSYAPLENINVDPKNRHYSSVDGVLYSKDKTVLISYPYGRQLGTFTVPDGVKTIDYRSFINCRYLTEVILPKGVTEIEAEAFSWDDKLEKITLPGSLVLIGHAAFNDCKSLDIVVYHGAEEDWKKVWISYDSPSLNTAEFSYDE